MNHINIGTDIIEIQRIQESYLRYRQRFLNRIFTQQEQEYCFHFTNPYPSLAGRFAAKEAVAKALGCGIGKIIQWKIIEITRGNQRPQVILPTYIQEQFQIQQVALSMSHCKDYAVATALVFHKL